MSRYSVSTFPHGCSLLLSSCGLDDNMLQVNSLKSSHLLKACAVHLGDLSSIWMPSTDPQVCTQNGSSNSKPLPPATRTHRSLGSIGGKEACKQVGSIHCTAAGFKHVHQTWTSPVVQGLHADAGQQAATLTRSQPCIRRQLVALVQLLDLRDSLRLLCLHPADTSTAGKHRTVHTRFPPPKPSKAGQHRRPSPIHLDSGSLWGQALVPLLSPLFQQRRYRKGEIMAKQGAPATTLFYIQSGECEVLHRLDAEGDEDFEDEVSRWCGAGLLGCWQLAGWEGGTLNPKH